MNTLFKADLIFKEIQNNTPRLYHFDGLSDDLYSTLTSIIAKHYGDRMFEEYGKNSGLADLDISKRDNVILSPTKVNKSEEIDMMESPLNLIIWVMIPKPDNLPENVEIFSINDLYGHINPDELIYGRYTETNTHSNGVGARLDKLNNENNE